MSDDEELVKRLRDSVNELQGSGFGPIMDEAADRIEALERNISAAERHLKRLARWLDLSDDELNNLPIGSIIDDHRKMQDDVNAAIAALKGETDE